MNKTHATPSFSMPHPDLERVDRVAQRSDMSRSQFIREHVMRAVEQAEREWRRIQRQIEQLSGRTTKDLEDLENRLLTKDRDGRTSEAEKRLLEAVQRILSERAGLAPRTAKPESQPLAEAA